MERLARPFTKSVLSNLSDLCPTSPGRLDMNSSLQINALSNLSYLPNLFPYIHVGGYIEEQTHIYIKRERMLVSRLDRLDGFEFA